MINGEKETENTAGEHDVVVKGPSGEDYLIGIPMFIDRYIGPALSDEFQEYAARGNTLAVKWIMPKMSFIASWGETMIINPGDMLCSIDGKTDFYRIEKSAFKKTYAKV